MLKILVVGAGAIGCFIGGRLAATGQQVTLLGRPALMDKIAANGLELRHPTQPAQTVHPQTATSLADISDGFDFVLISVKAPDTPQVIAELTAARVSGRLVSLQNGIGNEELLAEAFGRDRVVAGTITIPIGVPAQGAIEVSKDKGGLGLAPLQSGQPVEQLAGALNQAGLTTPVFEDYRAMKWSKLLLNIINNATSAILDMPPVEIVDNPQLFNMEIEALHEGLAVMKAQDIQAVKLPGYPVNWLARLVNWPLPMPLKRSILRPFMVSGRGTKMPSLHIDMASGRTTSEISVLNGAIAAAGQQANVPIPVNQTLTDILSQLISRQLDWAEYQHQPEKLLQAIADEKQSG